MGIPALVAAQAERDARAREEEQQLLDAFRIAGAVSRERALPLSQLNVVRGELFNRLETARVLQLVGRNLYYLDENARNTRDEQAESTTSGRSVMIVVLVVVALLALAAILYYRR